MLESVKDKTVNHRYLYRKDVFYAPLLNVHLL